MSVILATHDSPPRGPRTWPVVWRLRAWRSAVRRSSRDGSGFAPESNELLGTDMIYSQSLAGCRVLKNLGQLSRQVKRPMAFLFYCRGSFFSPKRSCARYFPGLHQLRGSMNYSFLGRG